MSLKAPKIRVMPLSLTLRNFVVEIRGDFDGL